MEKYFNINKSGHSVRCKIYFGDLKNIKTVIICGHGFGGHKDNRASQKIAEYVLKKFKDIAVMTFNMPCHGDDVKKKLHLEDCSEYIRLVCEHVSAEFSPEKILGYATSFGGYLFLKYISEHDNPFNKLALRCPAINMFDVLTGRIITPGDQKALSAGKPISAGFDRKITITRDFTESLKAADISERDFKSYSSDILILHGTADEIVPFDRSKEFCEKNGITLVPVDGADHRFQDPSKMDAAIKKIVEFYGLVKTSGV